MEFLKLYGAQEVNALTRKRAGEEKIGEKVKTLSGDWEKHIRSTSGRYVIVGIPEDIGIRANYGRSGAHTAFKPGLESFLSQQSNDFLTGENTIVLGEIQVNDLMERAHDLDSKSKKDIELLRVLVSELDDRVSSVLVKIFSAGKIPIVIGGGHNNAFGNIKAAHSALRKKINVINCDQHLDFRPLDGRHSGNAFSYAFSNDFLGKYAVFGMHEQYNLRLALNQFKENAGQLWYSSYESIFVREEVGYSEALQHCIGFVKGEACGVELDMDAITNAPTSAKTSSGLSPVQARQFVYQCARKLDAVYFHVAEAAPVLSHIKADNKTGKLIAYLISDFMKGADERLQL
jgi:formiminoglutamase